MCPIDLLQKSTRISFVHDQIWHGWKLVGIWIEYIYIFSKTEQKQCLEIGNKKVYAKR